MKKFKCYFSPNLEPLTISRRRHILLCKLKILFLRTNLNSGNEWQLIKLLSRISWSSKWFMFLCILYVCWSGIDCESLGFSITKETQTTIFLIHEMTTPQLSTNHYIQRVATPQLWTDCYIWSTLASLSQLDQFTW